MQRLRTLLAAALAVGGASAFLLPASHTSPLRTTTTQVGLFVMRRDGDG